MKLAVLSQTLQFLPVKLQFHAFGIVDLFGQKNDKTVEQTLASRKYSCLSPEVQRRYGNSLFQPLGKFLLQLKTGGDVFYLRFLNKYGDMSYCDFAISEHLKSKGLYCFTVGDKLKYVGRSHDPFERRINQGYGHLSPKNCYRDGQATNCHLNSLIASEHSAVSLHVCVLESDALIDSLEKALIRQEHPDWNIALKGP